MSPEFAARDKDFGYGVSIRSYSSIGGFDIPPHAVHLGPRQRDEDGRQYQGEIVQRLLPVSSMFRRFQLSGCLQKRFSGRGESTPIKSLQFL